MKGKNGNILVQVLLAAVVGSVIAAGIMNLILQRATVLKRAQDSEAGKARVRSTLDAIIRGWSAAGGVTCSPVNGYIMNSGMPGNCDCSYTSADGTATIAAKLVNGQCTLNIVGSPPP
ncbi:MAG: hypothetical protein NTY77_00445 [Elusimicrobia bacterium]|nr:hypothetical protein [Elusimicrobiota bacterium]